MTESVIERSIIDFLDKRAGLGASIADFEVALPLTRKQLWSALTRLDRTERVFRFKVDGTAYMALTRDRAIAYVEQHTHISEALSLLYSRIGISMPKVIRRTPQFVILGDDDVVPYSRYAEENRTRSQKLRDAGFTRRKTGKSVGGLMRDPEDDDSSDDAGAEAA